MLITNNLSTYTLQIKLNVEDKLLSKISKKEYIFKKDKKYRIELLK